MGELFRIYIHIKIFIFLLMDPKTWRLNFQLFSRNFRAI